jgi:hypothetical protein
MHMRTPAACLAVVILSSCTDPTAPSGPPASVAGQWRAISELASSDGAIVCHDTTQTRVGQVDDSVHVESYHYGHCDRVGDEPVEISYWQSDDDGRVRGNRLTYADPLCRTRVDLDPDDGTGATPGIMVGRTACAGFFAGLGLVDISGETRMHRADFVPPEIEIGTPTTGVTHGDTVAFSVTAKDSVALAWAVTIVTFPPDLSADCVGRAPATQRDSLPLAGLEQVIVRQLVVPVCTGGLERIRVVAGDTAGNVVESLSEPVSFTWPMSTVAAHTADTVYTGGELVRIFASAENPRGLSWIGVRVGEGVETWSDSVAVTGTSAEAEFERMSVPVEYIGGFSYRVFARHLHGHLTLSDPLGTRLTDALRVPTRVATLPRTPFDRVIADDGETIYLTDTIAPVLRVLRPATFETVTTIALDAPATSVELLPSGDSLLVTQRGALALSVVSVATGGRVTIPMVYDDPGSPFSTSTDVRYARVLAGGLYLVAIGEGTGGGIHDLARGTGALTRLSTWFSASAVQRSFDRSHLFLDAIAGPSFVAATESFLTAAAGAPPMHTATPRAVDMDASASTVLVGCRAYTAALAPVRAYEQPYPVSVAAISRDGSRVYCARYDGVDEFDAATGTRLRSFWTPNWPTSIRVLPGERLLVGIGPQMRLLALPSAGPPAP